MILRLATMGVLSFLLSIGITAITGEILTGASGIFTIIGYWRLLEWKSR